MTHSAKEERVTDVEILARSNERFIDACRQGSWELLEPILSASFSYLDGRTGEVWDRARYADDLRENPAPGLAIDDVVIHVDGDAAIVSARSGTGPKLANRYLDTYTRSIYGWQCVHACVWPVTPQ